MRFTIVLNSRERPGFLSNLLDSIYLNTSKLDSIEVFVSCDNDDEVTKTWYFQEERLWNKFCHFEFVPRNINLHERINNLIPQFKGQYVWILNDDTEIVTKGWDIIAYLMLEKYDMPYGHVKCTSVDKERDAQYSSFPIISKKAINILGHLVTPKLPGLGGDVYLWRIFNHLNKVIDLPITVRHVLHESVERVINCDQTATDMRQYTKSHSVNCWTMDLSEDIKKLNESLFSL